MSLTRSNFQSLLQPITDKEGNISGSLVEPGHREIFFTGTNIQSVIYHHTLEPEVESQIVTYIYTECSLRHENIHAFSARYKNNQWVVKRTLMTEYGGHIETHSYENCDKDQLLKYFIEYLHIKETGISKIKLKELTREFNLNQLV